MTVYIIIIIMCLIGISILQVENTKLKKENTELKMEVIMKRFRKKPIVVEAYQTDVEIMIETLEGPLKADVGDWIITGIRGEKYPCKPDVFDKTYEEAKNIISEV